MRGDTWGGRTRVTGNPVGEQGWDLGGKRSFWVEKRSFWGHRGGIPVGGHKGWDEG